MESIFCFFWVSILFLPSFKAIIRYFKLYSYFILIYCDYLSVKPLLTPVPFSLIVLFIFLSIFILIISPTHLLIHSFSLYTLLPFPLLFSNFILISLLQFYHLFSFLIFSTFMFISFLFIFSFLLLYLSLPFQLIYTLFVSIIVFSRLLTLIPAFLLFSSSSPNTRYHHST